MTALTLLPTNGDRFYELEEMGGTSGLGLIAIKNLFAAFMHILHMSKEADATLINCRDVYGNSCMHYWALRGATHAGFLGMLEERGGMMRLCNRAGQSVLDVFERRRVTCMDPCSRFGAEYCAVSGHITVVLANEV